MAINKSTLPFADPKQEKQYQGCNYDIPILSQPNREPSESPYVHQTQNIKAHPVNEPARGKEEVLSSMMNYELEPAPRTLIDGSAVDVEMPQDDHDEMRMQYRFQTVVPNIIDTARNTISPNTMHYNLSNKELQGQNEKIQQMMDMIAQLQQENQKLKVQDPSSNTSPKFAFAGLGSSSEHPKTDPKPGKDQGYRLSHENDFQMDSMSDQGAADQQDINLSSASLKDNPAERIEKEFSQHFKEIDDYISQHTSKASGSRSSNPKENFPAEKPPVAVASYLFAKKSSNPVADQDIKQTCMFGYQGEAENSQKLSKEDSQGTKIVEFQSFDPQEAERRLSATPKEKQQTSDIKQSSENKNPFGNGLQNQKSTKDLYAPPIRNTINPNLIKKAPKPQTLPEKEQVSPKVEDRKLADSFMQIYTSS